MKLNNLINNVVKWHFSSNLFSSNCLINYIENCELNLEIFTLQFKLSFIHSLVYDNLLF